MNNRKFSGDFALLNVHATIFDTTHSKIALKRMDGKNIC